MSQNVPLFKKRDANYVITFTIVKFIDNDYAT
jgi:hypothetical protein